MIIRLTPSTHQWCLKAIFIIVFFQGFITSALAQGYGESTIFGNMEVCNNTTHTYTTDYVPEGSYNYYWEAIGGNIVGINTDQTVAVTWSFLTSGTGTLRLYSQLDGFAEYYLEATNDVTVLGGTGGTVGNVDVCQATSSTIMLTRHSGTIQYWQKSTNNGSTWTDIASTSTDLPIGPFYGPQDKYRAVVKDDCDVIYYSDPGSVSIYDAAYLVQLSSSPICPKGQSGELGIEGSPQSFVEKWEMKLGESDSSNPWSEYSTSQTCSYNVQETTSFRVTISNGVCGTTEEQITIHALTHLAPGAVTPNDQHTCDITNANPLQINSAIGTVQWQYFNPTSQDWEHAGSGNSFSSFSLIPISSTPLIVRFRARVSSFCGETFSNESKVILDDVPFAGVDQTGPSTCGLTALILSANTPLERSGTWSIVGGTGGSVVNSANPNSEFIGIAGNSYLLQWAVNGSSCPDDEVTLKFNQNPSQAIAGIDQTDDATCGLTSATLDASNPQVGTGQWNIFSGTGGYFGSSAPGTQTSGNRNSAFSGLPGNTYALQWIVSNAPCSPSTDHVVVTFNMRPTPTITNGPADACVNSEGNQYTTQAGMTGYSWSAPGGTITHGQGTNQITVTWNGTGARTVSVHYTAANGCESVTPGTRSVTVHPNPASIASVTGNNHFGPGLLSLNATGANTSTGETYKWFDPSGEFLDQGSPYTLPGTIDASVNNYCYVQVASSHGCLSVQTWVDINIYDNPVVISDKERVVAGMDATLTTAAAPGYYDEYSWLYEGNPLAGQTTSAHETKLPGTYFLHVTKGGISTQSEPFELLGQFDGLDENYILTYTMLQEGIIVPEGIEFQSIDNVSQTIQYFDGLGRHIQTVATQASPGKNDIVQPIVYDALGRETLRYLPFTGGTDGWYKPNNEIIDPDTKNYIGIAAGFYSNNPTGKIAQDDRPFSEIVFEPSPLHRVLKQGASGSDWQPNANVSDYSDKTIKKEYRTNLENEVLLWRYDATTHRVSAKSESSLVYYPPNELLANYTFDEHNNRMIEYVDKEGKTILKRVQFGAGDPITTGANRDVNYASTYYIHNQFGDLVTVLPPEAVKLLGSYYHSVSTSNQDIFLKNWAFRYKYDVRKRMTEKQVPGADPVYMVYDSRDRLVLSQDGNQRSASTKYWAFTKYDETNRPIMTGIKDTSASLTQVQMQDVVNAHYDKNWSKFGEIYIGNTAGNVHGYTNRAYPVVTTTTVVDASKYLTVTYYDNYNFRSTWIGDYGYINETLTVQSNGITSTQPVSELLRVKGLITGTKVKVLDGGLTGGYTWLNSVNYYDDNYRVIQTIKDNYRGGTDGTTNLYDFTGKPLKSMNTHKTNKLDWKDFINAKVVGNKIVKTSNVNGFNSGASSMQQLEAGADGWVEFVISETSGMFRAFGLSDHDTGTDYTTIDYAFWIGNNAGRIYEGGSLRLAFSSSVASGDIFRIERQGATIKYYVNGSLIYTSTSPSNTSLLVDVSISGNSGNVVIPRASFNSKETRILRTFEYDHTGRLLNTWHQVNTQQPVLIAQNTYNELGQLVDKRLHSTSETVMAAKQSVDYRYNIRGWLTKMNEIDLSMDDTGDPLDYFSLELGYNNDLGLGSSLNYNGNISSVKWSSYLQASDVKLRGYSYDYDALNRMTDALYMEGTESLVLPTWTTPVGNAFSESGYTYDLNGNLKTLSRKGAGGSIMDNLTYLYGNGSSQSNRLLTVIDSGDKTEGFTELGGSGTDYSYDGNGNMIWDRNKGGIEALTNGGFSQGSASWTVADAGNRLTFQNDSVKITSGSSQAVISQLNILDASMPYIVIIDMKNTSGAIVTINLGQNVAYAWASGKTITRWSSGAGKDITITIPSNFVGSINSIEVKGLVTIGYNYMNLPETVTKASDHYLSYFYDATGKKLSQKLYNRSGSLIKETDYVGEFYYENDTLKFINHEEGRVVMTGEEPEYQYHLKDHLGNVRLTFTTKDETEIFAATLELASQTSEANTFSNYNPTDRDLFDHTDAGTAYTYAQLLHGGHNSQVGLAKSLSVMPGDTVKAEVYAKYQTLPDPGSGLLGFAAALTSAFGLSAPLPGDPAGPYDALDSYGSLIEGGFDHSDDGNAPKAFINLLLFDRDHNFVDAAYAQIGINDYQGTDLNVKDGHGYLAIDKLVTTPGYAYIFVSNENPTQVDVYFDDLKITHAKSPVVQMDDYYPFGLAFNSYSRENSVANNYLYNGKEKQDELDLGWLDYGARMFMPDIGRWSVIDGKSELYFATTPYAYALNQPTNAIDPDGNLVIFINGNHYGSGGGASYWRSYTNVKVGERYSGSKYGEQFYSPVYERRESYAFDKAVMNHVGDQHAVYRDGAVGGWAPVNPTGHELAFTRKAVGYLQGQADAEAIIQSLARDKSGNITESIKIITHSMGGAYGKGYAKALLEYARQHNIQGVNIAFVADFAPFQSGQLEAEQGENVGPTLQFSHSNDMVAGNDPEKGAQQQDTSGDKNQGHSIFSFMNQVSKLPTGKYRVVNGQIIPEREKKKKKNND